MTPVLLLRAPPKVEGEDPAAGLAAEPEVVAPAEPVGGHLVVTLGALEPPTTSPALEVDLGIEDVLTHGASQLARAKTGGV